MNHSTSGLRPERQEHRHEDQHPHLAQPERSHADLERHQAAEREQEAHEERPSPEAAARAKACRLVCRTRDVVRRGLAARGALQVGQRRCRRRRSSRCRAYGRGAATGDAGPVTSCSTPHEPVRVLDRDAEHNASVRDHRAAVVVPVRVLAGDRSVDLDQLFDRVVVPAPSRPARARRCPRRRRTTIRGRSPASRLTRGSRLMFAALARPSTVETLIIAASESYV